MRLVTDSMEIQWDIQENRRNGKKLKYKSNVQIKELCAVDAAVNLVFRARQLGQPDNRPSVSMTSTNKGSRRHRP
jgi:hypothetical protein